MGEEPLVAANGIFIDILLLLVTVVSVSLVIWQIRKDRKLKEAEYLLNFNTTLVRNRKLMDVYYYCAREAGFMPHMANLKFKKEYLSTKDVIEYLDFFEPLFYLVKNKVISVDKLSDLIEHRFFVVACNKDVQSYVIKPYPTYFGTLYQLYDKMKKNLDIKAGIETYDITDDIMHEKNLINILSYVSMSTRIL